MSISAYSICSYRVPENIAQTFAQSQAERDTEIEKINIRKLSAMYLA